MRKFRAAVPLVCATLCVAAPATAAQFVVTAENPGQTSSGSTFTYSGVESFTGAPNTGWNGTTNYSSNFGSSSSGVTGTYTGVSVASADQYGGAGNTGQYALARQNGSSPVSYTLNLATNQAQGINYFGAWISAIDNGNELRFYNGDTLLYSFSAAQLISQFSSNPYAASYYGNPSAGGANNSQAYAFLNFYSTDGNFDRVVFTENLASSGFESDNHTVGRYATTSGYTVATGGVSPVPEPASWTLMIGGFGLIGFMLRRTCRSQAVA